MPRFVVVVAITQQKMMTIEANDIVHAAQLSSYYEEGENPDWLVEVDETPVQTSPPIVTMIAEQDSFAMMAQRAKLKPKRQLSEVARESARVNAARAREIKAQKEAERSENL